MNKPPGTDFKSILREFASSSLAIRVDRDIRSHLPGESFLDEPYLTLNGNGTTATMSEPKTLSIDRLEEISRYLLAQRPRVAIIPSPIVSTACQIGPEWQGPLALDDRLTWIVPDADAEMWRRVLEVLNVDVVVLEPHGSRT